MIRSCIRDGFRKKKRRRKKEEPMNQETGRVAHPLKEK